MHSDLPLVGRLKTMLDSSVHADIVGKIFMVLASPF